MATAARRRIPPRQRHLAGHPSALFRRGHPGGSLIGATLPIQCGRRPGLTCGRGRLHPLQPGDLLDQRSLIGMRIHRHELIDIEHTYCLSAKWTYAGQRGIEAAVAGGLSADLSEFRRGFPTSSWWLHKLRRAMVRPAFVSCWRARGGRRVFCRRPCYR